MASTRPVNILFFYTSGKWKIQIQYVEGRKRWWDFQYRRKLGEETKKNEISGLTRAGKE